MVALVGGNEFRRECEPMDRALLALAGGQGARVVILPTAATNENPEVAGANGVRHFERLGATAEKVMVVDEASARDAELAVAIAQASIVYLTGGDPRYLLETMRGTPAWDAVLSVHERGRLVAGSSAGAMVLGEQMWRFDGWTAGLGLAPDVAVLPHHATLSQRWNASAMQSLLPPGVTLVGIDEATALLLPEGQVLGAGQVMVYRGDERPAYGSGARVPLRPLLE